MADSSDDNNARDPSTPELGIVEISPFKSDIIEILVGANEEQYYVHKATICEASPFFRRCLEVTMKETSMKVVKLPEDDPEAFQCILQWVYSKVLEKPKQLEYYNSRRLFRAYLLADKLCMELLCNLLMDMIMEWHETLWSYASMLPEIPASPLKDYLVTQLAWDLECSPGDIWKESETSKSPEDFFRSGTPEVVEVMKANTKFALAKYPRDPAEGSKCKYHRHVDTDKCTEEEETTDGSDAPAEPAG